jgi:hypothetical protein
VGEQRNKSYWDILLLFTITHDSNPEFLNLDTSDILDLLVWDLACAAYDILQYPWPSL